MLTSRMKGLFHMADGSYSKNNNFKSERPRYALNDFRMTLQGKRAEGGLKPQGVRFEIDADGVRIIASTGIDGDEDYGQIRVNMSLMDASLVMSLLEAAPRRFHPGKYEEVAVATSQFNRNSNKRENKHQATVRIGRNDAGVLYIQIASWKTSRPKVLVEFLPSNFIRLVDQEGNQAPADKVSELMVVSYAKMMCEMLPLAFTNEYARVQGERDARKAQGGQGGGNRGGGGGNYQRGQGGGGGSPAPSPAPSGGGYSGGDYDFGGDDLPM
jgi:hypothetical protein